MSKFTAHIYAVSFVTIFETGAVRFGIAEITTDGPINSFELIEKIASALPVKVDAKVVDVTPLAFFLLRTEEREYEV